MENKTSPQTKETVGQTVEQVRQSSRRTFLTLAVAASGGGPRYGSYESLLPAPQQRNGASMLPLS
jgi:predicted nucleotide-binding protein (sugar kinase/HSP70/actin superfamily)